MRMATNAVNYGGNEHAPNQYRALEGRNIDAWYKAFEVKPGDKLYLAPKDRVQIW